MYAIRSYYDDEVSDSLIYMAFITGLMGAGHCIGMCGGLVGALSLSEAGKKGDVITSYSIHYTKLYDVAIQIAVG